MHRLVKYCSDNGERLTQNRKAAFAVLKGSRKPLTAYNILTRMQAMGCNGQPPTAYRALEFLILHGFVHRIESLNAYVAAEGKGRQFVICDKCGTVWQRQSHVSHGIEDTFYPSTYYSEVHGLCQPCYMENRA